MAQIAPQVEEKFKSLSPELQSAILETGKPINSIFDLISCLEEIVGK